MRNPLFDLFGGRKNFNAYFFVALVIAGMVTGQVSFEVGLGLVAGVLGITNYTIAREDAGK